MFVVRAGKTNPTNITLNTDSWEWDVVGFDQMYIDTKK